MITNNITTKITSLMLLLAAALHAEDCPCGPGLDYVGTTACGDPTCNEQLVNEYPYFTACGVGTCYEYQDGVYPYRTACGVDTCDERLHGKYPFSDACGKGVCDAPLATDKCCNNEIYDGSKQNLKCCENTIINTDDRDDVVKQVFALSEFLDIANGLANEIEDKFDKKEKNSDWSSLDLSFEWGREKFEDCCNNKITTLQKDSGEVDLSLGGYKSTVYFPISMLPPQVLNGYVFLEIGGSLKGQISSETTCENKTDPKVIFNATIEGKLGAGVGVGQKGYRVAKLQYSGGGKTEPVSYEFNLKTKTGEFKNTFCINPSGTLEIEVVGFTIFKKTTQFGQICI